MPMARILRVPEETARADVRPVYESTRRRYGAVPMPVTVAAAVSICREKMSTTWSQTTCRRPRTLSEGSACASPLLASARFSRSSDSSW